MGGSLKGSGVAQYSSEQQHHPPVDIDIGDVGDKECVHSCGLRSAVHGRASADSSSSSRRATRSSWFKGSTGRSVRRTVALLFTGYSTTLRASILGMAF
ncbi:hypothetical protein PsYK624_141840 [Phanerochaete sordida]|uniref:Uncharacterized protein n=1 Tax=Phanerochaete sordida TaxID=48140 RepID=A0A9P3LL61_9APHY|nr:hypothetical protein PsYK624_141840 [Phanerochaete sordida]